MWQTLSMGLVLGLSAGVAPGPLLALVISETLQHGIRSGIQVALAPILTDLPIILLTLFVLSRLSDFHAILGVISLVGGGVVLCMGIDSFRAKEVEAKGPEVNSKSFTKGVLVNALSPHPYLFWFSVGGPIILKAMNQGLRAPLAFVVSFYTCLLGAKIGLAILVGKSRPFLRGRTYTVTVRILGLVLCALALFLFRDGLQLLGVIQ